MPQSAVKIPTPGAVYSATMGFEGEPWPELCARIRAARAAGRVTAVAKPAPEGIAGRAGADELALALGYSALGERWIEVDEETARQILVRVLARDLAQDTATMSLNEANDLAAAFVELAAPATFFTNGSWCAGAAPLAARVRVGPFWTPITAAAFDAGIVAVATSVIAMVWVVDEDD